MKNKLSLLISCLFLSSVALVNCNKSDKITVVYPTDCAHRLEGAYLGSDYCNSSQPAYPCTVTAIDSSNVTFSNLGGVPVTAVLDCGKNSILIPTQSFSGSYSLSGTGNYTASRIIINWSGLSFGVPINCSSTFTR